MRFVFAPPVGSTAADAEGGAHDQREALRRRDAAVDRRERHRQVAAVDVPRSGADEAGDGVAQLVQDGRAGQRVITGSSRGHLGVITGSSRGHHGVITGSSPVAEITFYGFHRMTPLVPSALFYSSRQVAPPITF